jgi:peptidyl-prolyl cis-trans isomerase C
LLVIVWSSAGVAGDAPDRSESVRADNGVFAVIGDETVAWERYEAVARALARQRFFHGDLPSGKKVEEFNRDVARTVVDRTLLLQEAKRRGYEPRQEKIEGRIATVDARNQRSPGWRSHRDALLLQLRSELEENDLLEQLETGVLDSPRSDEAEIRRYYDTNQDKFIVPARSRVSLILQQVAPWASSQQWQDAADRAQQLVARLRDGEDFATLARAHSDHESAPQGGDLGVVHQGMLAAEAQRVVDGLAVGEVSDPVRLLQGIALLRRDETIPSALSEFPVARARAAELLQREQGEQAWSALIQRLRDNTRITIYREPAAPQNGQPGMQR